MRGLYLLAFVALCGVASARNTAFNRNDLPAQIRSMDVHEIVRSIESSLGLKNQRSALDDAIVAMLEKFREKMPEGLPLFGIPPLDPLFIPHLDYNLTSDLMGVNGYISQSSVQELSGFIIDVCKVNIIRTSLDLQLTFPAVNMGGIYDIDGVLALLPIYGTGPYTLTLHNLVITGSINMATKLDGTVYIKTLPLDVALEALSNNFEGLMGGGAMGEMVNDMITDMAPLLLDSVKDQILGPISNLIMAKANAFLSNYTMAELIDLILNGPGGGDVTTSASVF